MKVDTEQALIRWVEEQPDRLHVVLGDLDRFKDVNHLYGRPLADALLVAARSALPPGAVQTVFVGDEVAMAYREPPNLAGVPATRRYVACLQDLDCTLGRMRAPALFSVLEGLAWQGIHVDPWPRRRGHLVLADGPSWDVAMQHAVSTVRAACDLRQPIAPVADWLWDVDRSLYVECPETVPVRWSFAGGPDFETAERALRAVKGRGPRRATAVSIETLPASSPVLPDGVFNTLLADQCRLDAEAALLQIVPAYSVGAFKDVNDGLGRQVGDAVVRRLEACLVQALKGMCRRARVPQSLVLLSRFVDTFRIYWRARGPSDTAVARFIEEVRTLFNREVHGLQVASLVVRQVPNRERLDAGVLLRRLELTSLCDASTYDSAVEAQGRVAIEARAWQAWQQLWVQRASGVR